MSIANPTPNTNAPLRAELQSELADALRGDNQVSAEELARYLLSDTARSGHSNELNGHAMMALVAATLPARAGLQGQQAVATRELDAIIRTMRDNNIALVEGTHGAEGLRNDLLEQLRSEARRQNISGLPGISH